jgi:anti-anti-sigma factor
MDVQVTESGGVAVVAVSGRIDAYTAPEVEARLTAAAVAGHDVVIDLSETDYISSAGLRVLLTLAKRARGTSFDMRLCGLREAVTEVLDIAGLIPLFEIRTSRDEALRELSQS